ncbi:sperm-associated antigen 1 isoform X3 [Hyla sarda]|uniref:sperm-associated antigen 1 isoform X3 n=1 Tax=Hyla sarda TaxID=327740 RepID=UPI0024C23CDD|nr:sperm-associated antigen 1 isoform X3 [Hyla sarda]
MSGYYQGTTKTHQIPVDHLDYKFIEECKDVKHLEKILRVLRLGEEGLYPDLTAFCEKRIEALSPNNRALRKDKPPATAADFSLEDWQEIGGDLKNFLTEIKLTEQRPPFQQTTDNLPPIRNSSNAPATNKQKGKEYQSAGSKVPRDYRDWDRLDIEKELSEIDKSKDNVEQSKTVINTTASKIKKNVATKGISLEQKRSLAEREKDKGNEAFRSGDFEEAILYYSRSISVLPTAVAYNNRAQTEIKLKNWQNALKDCDHALDLEPENVKALLRRAVVNKNLSNFQAASSDLQTILLHEPENPIAKKVLCEVEELQQKEKAEKSKKGRRIVIQDIEGSDEEHQDTSVKEKGSEDAEELGILYSNRAACHLKDGNCAQCIEDCSNALELQPFSLKPLLRRAMANESLEKYRQAYVDYKVALQIDSGMQLANDSINRLTRTLIDLDGDNWREKLPPIPSVPVSTQLQHQEKNMATTNARAEKEMGKSIEERFLSLKQEGNDYVKKCQYKEAEKRYTECLVLKPEECTVYTNRALCYLKLCQYEEARQDCECALQRDASNVKALYRRAQAYKGLKKYQDCARDLQKLLSVDPGVTEAKTLLTEITPLLSTNGEEKQRKKILIEEVEEKEKTSNPSNVDEDKDSLRKTHSSGITKPSNALEFEQLLNGMRAGKDQEGCAHLLSIIDPKDLPVFLSNKLDTETLLLIVQSLKHHVLEKNPALVYRHLAHLSSADRFSVVVLLLNQDEKDQVQSVLTSLSGMENENFDRDAISNLTKTYGL